MNQNLHILSGFDDTTQYVATVRTRERGVLS